MRICILGGTGYLGRRIISRLLENDNDIFCVHRKDSKSINTFRGQHRVEYVISDYMVLRDLFAKVKFDCIINASCTYMKGARIDDVVESNLIFPMRIMSLAVENYYGINSNCNNYNKIKNCDRRFDDKHLRLISIGTGLPDDFNIYTYTKKQFNKMGRFFSNEYGLEFINIELQNYFGENEPKNRFLPSVIDKLKNNEDIPLTQGEQLRDFVYVNDVVDAVLLLLNKTDIPPYMDVPLGTGEAPSIKDIVIYLKEILHSKSELLFGKIPLRPNEPSTYANLALYKMLGGKIKYTWKEGLSKMLREEGLL